MHCTSLRFRGFGRDRRADRFAACKLVLHPRKTRKGPFRVLAV
jgi:hypothetical protein